MAIALSLAAVESVTFCALNEKITYIHPAIIHKRNIRATINHASTCSLFFLIFDIQSHPLTTNIVQMKQIVKIEMYKYIPISTKNFWLSSSLTGRKTTILFPIFFALSYFNLLFRSCLPSSKFLGSSARIVTVPFSSSLPAS